MPTGTLRHEDLFPVCPETWVAIDTAVKFGHSFFRSIGKMHKIILVQQGVTTSLGIPNTLPPYPKLQRTANYKIALSYLHSIFVLIRNRAW